MAMKKTNVLRHVTIRSLADRHRRFVATCCLYGYAHDGDKSMYRKYKVPHRKDNNNVHIHRSQKFKPHTHVTQFFFLANMSNLFHFLAFKYYR